MECIYKVKGRCHKVRKMHDVVKVVTKSMMKNGMTNDCKRCNYIEVTHAKIQRAEYDKAATVSSGHTEDLFGSNQAV